MYTRIVIDLENRVEYKFTIEKDCFKVTLEGGSYKNIEYYNTDDNCIEFKDGKLSKKKYNDDKLIYSFTSTAEDLGEGIINVNNTYIDTIEVEPITDGTLITITAKTKLEFEIQNSTKGSKLYYSRAHIDEVSSISLSKKAKKLLVVIDAGHGGSDPGAIGTEDGEIDLQEKDVTLDVALMVQDILENSGGKVLMTRDTDDFVGLVERADIANENNADLFVSIHINSFTSPEANGTMVFYYALPEQTENTEKEEEESVSDEEILLGKILAQNIQDELIDILGTTDRGIADGSRFVVIKRSLMPAVLVECAFISNPEEKELMKTAEFRQKIANGISAGIIKTLNQIAG